MKYRARKRNRRRVRIRLWNENFEPLWPQPLRNTSVVWLVVEHEELRARWSGTATPAEFELR